MFTASFWRSAAERAVKSAAQALLGLWIGQQAFDLWSVDPRQAVGVAAGAAVLSLLTSIASVPVGPDGSPSLVTDAAAGGASGSGTRP